MKYGDALKKFIIIKKISLHFIDYNNLKLEIQNINFIELLTENIINFNKNYMEYYQTQNLNPVLLYEYLLINYLSINKLLKKMKKKNLNNYLHFLKDYDSIKKYLSKFEFFNHIINVPEKLNYKIDKTCPICLDKCTFPVTTECNHTFCWKCLVKTSFNFISCPYCRENTLINPAMIILNNLISCDLKYNPFNNKILENTDIKIDICSDLHIDQWSNKYINKYPCGIIKECPFEFKTTDSKYLIVAGDISDNLLCSIDYLNEISKYYEKILFVDGNHEHVHKYPDLYEKKYINNLINNDKIVYLSNKPYQLNNTVFIGACGWWDYNNSDSETIDKNHNYFDEWIPHFTLKDSENFINNVINKSIEEIEYLDNNIKKYMNDVSVKNIVIVTHTLPKACFFDDDKDKIELSTEYNTKFENLLKYDKITHWIFGHTHTYWDKKINNIQFYCNPRGRPEDYNREIYKLKQITI